MNSKKKSIALLLGGFVLGVVVTGVAVWKLMPGMMIVEHQSRFGFDETVSKLVGAVKAGGWSVPKVRDMNKTMAKHGVVMKRRVKIVEMCKAPYAKDVLSTDPQVSTLMPCAVGVYERGGKVYLSGMNMGLMGKMFGGNIARVMGDKVAGEEQAMLKSVVVN
jgi:uncharacterized protein (DUF302 family)